MTKLNDIGTRYYDGKSAGIVGVTPTISAVGLVLDVGACDVMLYDNATFNGQPQKYGLVAKQFTLVDNSINYIYADYNSGAPEYKLTSDVNLINESSTVPVDTILTSNGFAHMAHWNAMADGMGNKLHRRLVKTQRYAREWGLELTYNTGVFSIANGVVWRGTRAFDLNSVHSDGTGSSTWFYYYKVGGVWTSVTNQQYDNTYYQGTTDRIAVNNNHFLINWIFRGIEDHNHGYFILGDKEYANVAEAIAETAVPELPSIISHHAILVGRAIVEEGQTTFYPESAFTAQFSGTVINDHNTLGGLQGGITGEYYHLTNTEYTNLGNFNDGYNPVILWDDVRVSLANSKTTGSTPSNMTFGQLNATSGVYAWYFHNTDGAQPAGLSFEIQLPHGYMPGTDIRPHLHWTVIDAGTGNVGWEVGFTIFKNDGTTVLAHIAKATTTAAVPTQNTGKITAFPVISGTTYNLVESDIVLCWLKRDNTIGTNFANNAWVVSFDYHIQIEKDGTINFAPPFMP